MEDICYIAFDKNSGLLEQQARVKIVLQKSYESMAGSSFKQVIAELIQAEVNY